MTTDELAQLRARRVAQSRARHSCPICGQAAGLKLTSGSSCNQPGHVLQIDDLCGECRRVVNGR